MELNPNHPTTQAVRGHWDKFAALLMHKLGAEHVVITARDVERIAQGVFLTVQERDDGLHFRFVDGATAHQLARQHGGLPT